MCAHVLTCSCSCRFEALPATHASPTNYLDLLNNGDIVPIGKRGRTAVPLINQTPMVIPRHDTLRTILLHVLSRHAINARCELRAVCTSAPTDASTSEMPSRKNGTSTEMTQPRSDMLTRQRWLRSGSYVLEEYIKLDVSAQIQYRHQHQASPTSSDPVPCIVPSFST